MTHRPLLQKSTLATLILFSLTACTNANNSSSVNNDVQANAPIQTDTSDNDTNTTPTQTETTSTVKPAFDTQTITTFSEPWAMTALPNDAIGAVKLLVTQKSGELFVVDTANGEKTPVAGVPKVAYGGQGGLGDVTLAPDFVKSGFLYISYIEAGEGANQDDSDKKYGAKVIRANLTGLTRGKPALTNITPIWEQVPKVTGQGHYSHRLLFSPDEKYLFISSGERQKKDPAQDMTTNLGKIIRLYPDGSVPEDNPFANSDNPITRQIWTLGHRNVLGMAFDEPGNLWAHEMGPKGGDEMNLIEAGNNYGWATVSNGINYDGSPIPDHVTRPEFVPPKITWTPVISPASMSIYHAGKQDDFPAWQDKALLGGLSSKSIVVVNLASDGTSASEAYRYDMGNRIRSVLAIDGQVFALQDGKNGQLLELTPK